MEKRIKELEKKRSELNKKRYSRKIGAEEKQAILAEIEGINTEIKELEVQQAATSRAPRVPAETVAAEKVTPEPTELDSLETELSGLGEPAAETAVETAKKEIKAVEPTTKKPESVEAKATPEKPGLFQRAVDSTADFIMRDREPKPEHPATRFKVLLDEYKKTKDEGRKAELEREMANIRQTEDITKATYGIGTQGSLLNEYDRAIGRPRMGAFGADERRGNQRSFDFQKGLTHAQDTIDMQELPAIGERAPTEIEGVTVNDAPLATALDNFIGSIEVPEDLLRITPGSREERTANYQRGQATARMIAAIEAERGELPEDVKNRLMVVAAEGVRDPQGRSRVENVLRDVYSHYNPRPETEPELAGGGEPVPLVDGEPVAGFQGDGYWEFDTQIPEAQPQQARPAFDLSVEALDDSHIDPLRVDYAQRMAAAASDPMGSDILLNTRQREIIQAEKERATQEYGAVLKDLMQRSEQKAFTKNMFRALGMIASGTVGLVSGLNVSKYYEPGEAANPADYFRELEPMISAKHKEQQQRYEELSDHYRESLGYYLQNTEVAKALVQFERDQIAANTTYFQTMLNAQIAVQRLALEGDSQAQQDISGAVKAIEAYYNGPLEEAETEIAEAREGLKAFQKLVEEDYKSPEREAARKAVMEHINKSQAAKQGNWQMARTAFTGTMFDQAKMDELYQGYVQSGMDESTAVRQVFNDVGEFASTNPSTYLREALASDILPPQQLDNIARYNLLYAGLYRDESNPLNSPALNQYLNNLAEAKQTRNLVQQAKNQHLQTAVAAQGFGGSARYVPGITGVTQSMQGTQGAQQPRAARSVPLAPARPVRGSPLDVSVINPPGGVRNDMSGLEVRGRHGIKWKGIDGNAVRGDLGVPRGETYYLPSHVTDDPQFMPKLYDVASDIGIEPNDLLSIMALESAHSFHPMRVNDIGATGLIQFIPRTSAGLLNEGRSPEAITVAGPDGKPIRFSNTEAQAYMASLPRNQQLDYVAAYLKDARSAAGIPADRKLSAGQFYTLILMGPRGVRTGWSTTGQAAQQNGAIVRGALAARKRLGKPDNGRIDAADIARYFDENRVFKDFQSKEGAAPLQSPDGMIPEVPTPLTGGIPNA